MAFIQNIADIDSSGKVISYIYKLYVSYKVKNKDLVLFYNLRI